MRYTINVSGMLIADWPKLRKSVFGDAQPIFEQYGVGAFYLVEFAEEVTINDLGPLIKAEIVPFDNTKIVEPEVISEN
jgi:hypothetical protein